MALGYGSKVSTYLTSPLGQPQVTGPIERELGFVQKSQPTVCKACGPPQLNILCLPAEPWEIHGILDPLDASLKVPEKEK